jgi:hypothetical protein
MSNTVITLGVPLAAALMVGASTIAQTSEAPQTRPTQPQQSQTQRETPQSHDTADVETFRGCVEQDPSARGQIGASQQTGAEQTALLKKASRTSPSTRAGEMPQQTARQGTERSTAPSGASAATSEHHDARHGDASTYRLVAPGDSSFELVKFIGQQVEVRGTINPQPVPRDEVDDENRPASDRAVVAPPSTDFEDDHKALMVMTITKIADSCNSNE